MNAYNPSNTAPPGNDANKDPITNASGAHPVGTGLGAIGAGAAAGAVGGAIGGPVGAVAGAVVGAVVGGLGGKAVAEVVNPTVETQYWRDNYANRPYADPQLNHEQFAPAYQYGWESFGRRGKEGKKFDHIEADLSRGWDKAKGTSQLGWDKAKLAARDAWDRVESASRGPASPVST